MQGPAHFSLQYIFCLLTSSLLLLFLSSHLSAAPYEQAGSADNLLVFDAEHFTSNTAQGTHQWVVNRPKGYAGSGAVQASPNNGTNNVSGYQLISPVLSYDVNFSVTGTHYVWVRARGQSSSDDALHIGLNGQTVATSENINGFTASWSWRNLQNGATPATIDITNAGANTINLWMGEDGIEIDKIILTTNPAYIPSGVGPVESLNGVALTPGDIGGTLTVDSVLLANQTYNITADLIVDSSAMLTIQEGAVINVSAGRSIYAFGLLRVLGSEVADVIFTTSDISPVPGAWDSIRLYENGDIIEKANIQYATNGVSISGRTTCQIHNSLLTNNQNGVLIQSNTVESDNPVPTITENSIYGNNTNLSTNNFGNASDVVINANYNYWGSADFNAIHNSIWDQSDSIGNTLYPWVDTSRIWSDSLGTVHPAVLLHGPVKESTVLDVATPYELSRSIVRPGASLSIPAGTTIQAINQSSELVVEGSLEVTGTSLSPVLFTRTAWLAGQSSNRWAGVVVNSNDPGNKLDYVQIEHAITGITMNNGFANITNSTITNNGFGFRLTASSPTMTNNLMTGNGVAIGVFVSSNPVISQNSIINNSQGLYVSGDNVEANNPAPVVTQNSIYGNTERNYGAFSFGNPANTFLDATNNWWGTTDYATIEASIVDHNDFSTYPWVDISPIWADESGTIHPVESLRSNITQNLTLNPAVVYEVATNLTVDAGATLTVPAGTTITINNGAVIIVNGTIRVTGTVQSPVLFTSSTPAPVNPSSGQTSWEGIHITSKDPNNLIDNAIIEFANYGVRLTNAYATITNSFIRTNNRGFLIEAGSSALITQNSIYDNNHAVEAVGDFVEANNPAPVINNNSFSNHFVTIYAWNYANPTNTFIDAKDNWWGTTDFLQVLAPLADGRGTSSNQPWVDVTRIWADNLGTPHPIELLRHTVTQDLTLSANTTYAMVSRLTVNAGATLTIPDGVRIELQNGFPSPEIVVDGTIRVLGAVNNPVVFTSPTELSSAWRGFTINSNDPNNLISHAIIEYGAFGIKLVGGTATIQDSFIRDNGTGIRIEAGSNVTVQRNVITENSTGVYVIGDFTEVNNPSLVVNENSIYNNTNNNFEAHNFGNAVNSYINANNNWWGSTDFAAIYSKIIDYSDGGTTRPWVDTTTIWADSAGTIHPIKPFRGPVTQNTTLSGPDTYEMFESVTVNAGATLTIEPGVLMLVSPPSAGTSLVIDGTLRVTGTEADPVVFTPKTNPASVYWLGILINSNDLNNLINHAVIEYASVGVRFENATGTVSNSLIQNNTWGIDIYYASNPTIINNTIINNSVGIRLLGNQNDATNPQPVITGNDIYGNSNYAVEFVLFGTASNTVVDLTGNWWGTATPTNALFRYTLSATTVNNFSNHLTSSQNGIGMNSALLSNSYFSPNADGTLDSTVFSGALSASADWVVNVKNYSGAVVRTYSGTGTSISVDWDGQNNVGVTQPDGIYLFDVTVTAATGKITRPAIRKTVIDVLSPVAVITSPVNAAVMENIEHVDVIGTATDTNFQSSILEYSTSAQPGVWTAIGTAKTTQTINDLLVRWIVGSFSGDVPTLPPGDYNLRLTAADLAGNSSSTSITLTLSTIYFSNVDYDNKLINPVNNETVTVSFDINTTATVNWEFLNELTDVVVRQGTVNVPAAGTHTFTWDGRDAVGDYLPDDAYRFRMTATSGGAATSYDLDGPVGALYPTTSGGDSQNFNFYKNDYLYIEGASPNGPARLNLGGYGFSGSAPAADFNQHKKIPVIGGFEDKIAFLWDGRAIDGSILPVGTVFLHMSATSLKPNSVVVRGTKPDIRGTGTAPNIEVKSNPYLVTHSYDQLSTMIYRISMDSFVTIKLLPPNSTDFNDPAAVTIVNNQLLQAVDGTQQPIDHSFEWDGLDAIDKNKVLISEEGYYSFIIQATSQETGFAGTYRGTLRLYQ